jgi:hypothetical protein
MLAKTHQPMKILGKTLPLRKNLPSHRHQIEMLRKTLLTIRSLMKKVLSRSRLERTKRILMMSPMPVLVRHAPSFKSVQGLL